MAAELEKLIFEAEWFDKISSTLKSFYLYYYPSDNSVELYDLKARKTFLRRTKCEDISEKDFYIGAVVTIFSRSIKITGFADKNTKEKLSAILTRTFVLLESNSIPKLGEILKKITNNKFQLSNIKMMQINKEMASEIFAITDIDYFNTLTCGQVVALEILSKNGEICLEELKKLFKEDNVYCSKNKESSEKEIDCFFKKSKKIVSNIPPESDNCTCCVIKPHAVQEQLTGCIIDDIQEAGYTISAIQQFYLDPVNAEEFLEVYKGVLSDFAAMVSELQSGPCIAVKITHKDQNVDVVTEFRTFCGPMDPEMAKQLRPKTLRAKYGKTKIQNAVHCSDLPEDGQLEVDYFFKILNDN